MGLALTQRDVALLDELAEGRIAALQLAALSMQGRNDVSDSSPASPATTATSPTTSPRSAWPEPVE
jgi:ATP/maltotriose-dependent transcriptional regulator MalT